MLTTLMVKEKQKAHLSSCQWTD